MPELSAEPQSVSELTRQIRDLLQSNFDQVCCVGEVSNFVQARSGHLYFTLKDDQAQISTAMWKTRASRLRFEIENGMQLVVIGPVEVYPPRGSYQLIIEQAFPQGIGPLELAFRQLQERLSAEGLFDPSRKRPLPAFPRRIALVTSPTGAAVRDLLQVLTRRWPLSHLVVVPVPVQGTTAAPLIAAGIAAAQKLADVDLIITGRGGGSLEDLWPFNEEIVARAISACSIPIICAVGHEIDVSIADLVADRRALTPTEAAELAVPLRGEIERMLQGAGDQLRYLLRQKCRSARHQIDLFASRRYFRKPLDLLTQRRQKLDEVEFRLLQKMHQKRDNARQQINRLAGQLAALSPLNVLARGYCLTTDRETGKLIRSIRQILTGNEVSIQLHDGTAFAQISRTSTPPDETIQPG